MYYVVGMRVSVKWTKAMLRGTVYSNEPERWFKGKVVKVEEELSRDMRSLAFVLTVDYEDGDKKQHRPANVEIRILESEPAVEEDAAADLEAERPAKVLCVARMRYGS